MESREVLKGLMGMKRGSLTGSLKWAPSDPREAPQWDQQGSQQRFLKGSPPKGPKWIPEGVQEGSQRGFTPGKTQRGPKWSPEESQGVQRIPKGPKGDLLKRAPKRIPKGSQRAQGGLGTPLTSSSLYQESDSAVSTNQYSLEPPFMMLMLLMVSQPLRITCGHGAVMGPLWGRLSPQPPTAPTAPPPAQAHGSQHPVEELWIPIPPGRSGGSQGQRGQEGRDPQKPPDHMKPHPQPHTAPPANRTQRQQQPHSSQQLLAVPAAHRISRALSSPYSTL